RLPAFTSRTTKHLAAVLDDLEKQQAAGVVLDLRFCPGGLIDAGVRTAGLFLDRGSLVLTISCPAYGQKHNFRREGDNSRSFLPVVCLVNDTTAGSAEFLAAALQDH